MAQSLVTLFNLALSAVGTRSIVSSASENSREAEICNLWYPTIRDNVLKAAPWPTARTMARLSLLAERDFTEVWAQGDPQNPWTFAYAAPTDMLHPQFLENYYPFELGVRRTMVGDITVNQKVILTDVAEAGILYTYQGTDLSLWESDLFLAIAMGLASAVAMPLHGKPKNAEFALMQANKAIMDARVNAANQAMTRQDHIPDWLAARGVASLANPSGFIFPSGPLLSPYTYALTNPSPA